MNQAMAIEHPMDISNLVMLHSSKTIRVLHVDDDVLSLEVTKKILNNEGCFEVDSASSVKEALRKIAANNYEVIISDYEMPQKNGLEFLRTLKEEKCEIPFVLFTGKGREEVAINALNMGADGYFNKEGQPETVYGELLHGIRQIVRTARAEKKQKESEYVNQKMLASSPNLIYIYDLVEHRNIYANREVSNFLGYNADQVKAMGSKLFEEILHPDDLQAVVAHHGRFVNAPDNAVYEIEYRMKHVCGEWRWLRSRDILFARTPDGKGRQILGTCQEVTEEKKALAKIRDSELKYRTIFNNSMVGIFRSKIDGSELLDFNDKYLEIFGRTRSEMQGKPSIVHWADPTERKKLVRNLKTKGEVNNFECKMLAKNGEVKTCLTSVRLYFERGILEGIIIDISERKKAEESLRESENRFDKISSQTQGMLYQFKKRPDGTYCVPFASEAIRSIFGCSPEDVREDFSPIAKVILNEDREKVVGSIEDSAKNLTPWMCEYRVKTPGQQVKYLWGRSIPEQLSDGSIIWHGYNLDITDRKAIEQNLLENQEKFSALFTSNPDPVVFYDADFHVVEANPKFCKFFGYSVSELKGKDIAELIVPEERREESKIVRQKALSGPIEVVATRKRKDGSLVSVLMAGGPVRLGDKVIGAMFVYKDISEIITAQEALDHALTEAELLNEKLKVVGSLTRHDVRNKLSAVTGYSYIIKKQHPELEDVSKALGRMEQAVKEAVKIFDFAKTYEQIGVENLVDIDVQKAVQEATSMFSDLSFKVVNECDGLTVKADSLLRQLVYNLIDNTRKYGQKTTLSKVYYRKTTSGQLQLIYEDDGVGIPDESKGQLFKQGFSTGGSTGFGLFLSKKIIDVYGWNIEEVGKSGRGAKFIITIQ